MDLFLKDLRYGARMLRKTPTASLTAVIALALGIGLTTLMFSIVYGALLRGLPFDEQDELVTLWRTNPARGIERSSVTIHDFADWRAQQRSFEELAAVSTSSFNVAANDVSESMEGALMTASSFRVLGVRAVAGRLFTEEDDRPGAPPVLVLGWGAWQRMFAGDASVIGRTLRINGEETTVVGVLPRGFGFPDTEEAWMPLRLDPLQTPRGEGRTVQVFGRLRDATSLEPARVELAAIAQRLAREYPASNEGVGVGLERMADDRLNGEERTVLYTMFGAVVFVLLIACVNVANLLIGRAMIRTKEIGVRTALGASRVRIITQFLTESFALAVAGALVGTMIAWLGIRAFNAAIVDTGPPYWLRIQLDGAALLWTFVATLLAAFAAGAIPALQAARANTNEILKDEARGSSSFRLGPLSRALVAGEMALSVGLLVGAGLMMKSVVKLHTIDVGFDTSRIFHARVNLSDSAYAGSEARLRFAEELLARLQAIAAVESATLATGAPGMNGGWSSFAIEGATYAAPQDYPSAPIITVAARFLQTLDAEVVSGRAFTGQDRDGALPVAIVNRPFADRYFAGESALGRRVRVGGADSDAPWLTIVGIAPHLYPSGVENERPEAIYRPLAQASPGGFTILARTRAEPLSITPAIRAAVASLDRDLPLFSIGSLDDIIDADNWYYGVFGALFIAFGAAALFLASIGLYGVMSFSVSRRRREMGVRMAIGANAGDLLRLVFRQGMMQTAVGLAFGTVFALAVSSLVAAILFQVEPRDPLIFATIVAVLLATAALACWIPAVRAARVDPLEALRSE